MKNKNWWIVAAAGSLAWSAPTFSQTQEAEPVRSQHALRGQWPERAKEKLGRTDEQRVEAFGA